MKHTIILILALFIYHSAPAETYLVENGHPRAEIIISDQPARMTRIAAHEFRQQIEKISGARLPIITQPTGKAVKVFIGTGVHSPVKAEGLEHGAYRIATGADWMALIGDDTDFVPLQPFAMTRSEGARAQTEWEKLIGAPYGMPSPGLYKYRTVLPIYGEKIEVWGLDERGSFNAVCGFLHKLGARWYLPGELGEVLPSLKTIPLPKLDETVKPDFALRQFNFRLGTAGPDTALWSMRLGTRNDDRLQIGHGMATMTNREAVFAKHPEWFALYGGKRHFIPGYSKCQLCYSNEELFQETVRWARAQLDTYKLDAVAIMPPDGYTSICQCEKCKGKDSPERHERGLLSDHVWDFVNRVAREIAKTHPDAKVLNCAYGVYTLPPLKIAKLEPNVQVCIVGGRRPLNNATSKGEGETAPEALRKEWMKKTDNPLIIFENYPFTDRGWYLPGFAARSLVNTVKATRGISLGEDIWLTAPRDGLADGLGFNHFLVYFTARAYWGGADVDADAMLGEYCRLFYGPAGQEMLDFFNNCEENWVAMEKDKAKADAALALFDKAKAKAEPGSINGRRIALIDDYLKSLRSKSQLLGQKRGPVPTLRLVGDAQGIVIDGKLDDTYWQTCPVSATGRFRDLQTGRSPAFGTSFKAGWQGNHLVFAILCEERPGEKPLSASSRDGDQALWLGDAVEIQIATESHSYYQIAISPAGHVVTLDRGAPRDQWFGWGAKAEVATHIADDHWIIEISLPITADENDPLHQIIGRRPTQSLPWYVNLCRQRIREDGQEHSAYSPTGKPAFHEPMKFARLYSGRSHPLDADPTVTDYVIEYQAAEQKRDASAFLDLANRSGITDFQKAAALERAAHYDKPAAPEIIKSIPDPAVMKTAQMRYLLATAKAPELVKQFETEDFSKWPFWKRGEGLLVRGQAWFLVKDGARAEADLSAAPQWIGDPRTRETALLTLAQNREIHLKADDQALAAYETMLAGKTHFGSSEYLTALQGIARIQTRQGQFDEAIKTLNRAEPEKLQGVWRENIQKSIEAVNQARKPQ
jgi:hypothetical protein